MAAGRRVGRAPAAVRLHWLRLAVGPQPALDAGRPRRHRAGVRARADPPGLGNLTARRVRPSGVRTSTQEAAMTTRRRTPALLAVASLAVGALAACGAQPGDGSAGDVTSSATSSATPSATTGSGSTTGSRSADPIGLVGLWTWSRPPAALPASDPCCASRRVTCRGGATAAWPSGRGARARGCCCSTRGAAAVGSCPDPADTDAPGTTTTAGSRAPPASSVTATGWRLLDALGRAQARLRPGATLMPRADVDPSLAHPTHPRRRRPRRTRRAGAAAAGPAPGVPHDDPGPLDAGRLGLAHARPSVVGRQAALRWQWPVTGPGRGGTAATARPDAGSSATAAGCW